MDPFGAWNYPESITALYHGVQSAHIGLKEDYIEPRNDKKCLGFLTEKKIPTV